MLPGSPGKGARKKNRGERKAGEGGVEKWGSILQGGPRETIESAWIMLLRGEGLGALSTHPPPSLSGTLRSPAGECMPVQGIPLEETNKQLACGGLAGVSPWVRPSRAGRYGELAASAIVSPIQGRRMEA